MKLSRVDFCLTYVGIFILFRFCIIAANSLQNPSVNQLYALFIIFVSTSILMFLQLKIVQSLTALKLKIKTAGLISICAFILLLLTIIISNKLDEDYYNINQILQIIKDLSLMIMASSLGYIISFIIKEPNIILPVALFAGIVDYWGVTAGPLSIIMDKKPEILNNVAVHMPSPLIATPVTLIGMGDFLFFAIYFGVIYRYLLNDKSTFWICYGLLTLSMILVNVTDIILPALVPMGIAVIIANYRVVKLQKEEKLAIIILATILLMIFVLIKLNVFKLIFS